MKALGEFLRPEFINRVDEIICFNRLDEKNFVSIARIMLDELAASLAEKHQTVLARRKLIIETAYGRREFPLEEVRSAVVAEGTHQEDVLQLLREVTL